MRSSSITFAPGYGIGDTGDDEAPAQPGNYPFICTFPAHWRTMNGVLMPPSFTQLL